MRIILIKKMNTPCTCEWGVGMGEERGGGVRCGQVRLCGSVRGALAEKLFGKIVACLRFETETAC